MTHSQYCQATAGQALLRLSHHWLRLGPSQGNSPNYRLILCSSRLALTFQLVRESPGLPRPLGWVLWCLTFDLQQWVVAPFYLTTPPLPPLVAAINHLTLLRVNSRHRCLEVHNRLHLIPFS